MNRFDSMTIILSGIVIEIVTLALCFVAQELPAVLPGPAAIVVPLIFGGIGAALIVLGLLYRLMDYRSKEEN